MPETVSPADVSASREAEILATLGTRLIVLVGMMGAGKSTIGRRLAARLGLPFLDADSEIEVCAGLADAFDVDVPTDSNRACGLATYPASATPAASAATSANGAIAKSVSRPMNRIFIEHQPSDASNRTQRHAETRVVVDDRPHAPRC